MDVKWSCLAAIPGLQFKESRLPICCGSAGIYNVLQNEMAMDVLESKMANVNASKARVIVTANPGCMLQLEAGARQHGSGQRVAHAVEMLDEPTGTIVPIKLRSATGAEPRR